MSGSGTDAAETEVHWPPHRAWSPSDAKQMRNAVRMVLSRMGFFDTHERSRNRDRPEVEPHAVMSRISHLFHKEEGNHSAFTVGVITLVSDPKTLPSPEETMETYVHSFRTQMRDLQAETLGRRLMYVWINWEGVPPNLQDNQIIRDFMPQYESNAPWKVTGRSSCALLLVDGEDRTAQYWDPGVATVSAPGARRRPPLCFRWNGAFDDPRCGRPGISSVARISIRYESSGDWYANPWT